MLLWSLSAGLGLAGGRLLLLCSFDLRRFLPSPALEDRRLATVVALLHELEETLAGGALPAPQRWEALARLPDPWGPLASSLVTKLRARGAAVIPTLMRLRRLAESHRASRVRARARAAQALAQAGVCAALVPGLGILLPHLLPGLDANPWSWRVACAGAITLASLGAAWMLRLADEARWAGLAPGERPWLLAAQIGTERFLAILRSGSPADIAWNEALADLARESTELAAAWGHSAWSDRTPALRGRGASARLLLEFGPELRRAALAAAMEGRPCAERVESALEALGRDLEARVDQELGLLASRTLKPLFLCVAPSLLGLLGFGLWNGFSELLSAGGALP